MYSSDSELYFGDTRLYSSDLGMHYGSSRLYYGDSVLYCSQSDRQTDRSTPQHSHSTVSPPAPNSVQSFPLGAADSFSRRDMSCAVEDLYTCDRTAQQLLDIVQLSSCCLEEFLSCPHRIFPYICFSLHALLHVSLQTVQRLLAGWLAGYCSRPTNCTLWSPGDTQYHRYIQCSSQHGLSHDIQYHRYTQCGSQHGLSHECCERKS